MKEMAMFLSTRAGAYHSILAMALMIGCHCNLALPVSSPDDPVSPEFSDHSDAADSKSESLSYPRIVSDPMIEDPYSEMYKPGQSRSIQLSDGTEIHARTGEDYVELRCILPDGTRKLYRQTEQPDVNYRVIPVGRYVLIVSGVNAGPSGVGELLDPLNGKRQSFLSEEDYGDGTSQKYPISLYSLSLIESEPGIYLLAGTGNREMFQVDVRKDPPQIQNLPFREVPLDAQFGALIKDRKIYYRFRDSYSEEPSWKIWPLKGGD
ncbi:MAG: hypothetical protein RH862_03810 [Leptospiraceae bacterium]